MNCSKFLTVIYDLSLVDIHFTRRRMTELGEIQSDTISHLTNVSSKTEELTMVRFKML